MKSFTQREKQIIKLILEEYSNAKIALELGISEKTVEAHRKSIYTKADVSNVVGLVKHIMKIKSLNN